MKYTRLILQTVPPLLLNMPNVAWKIIVIKLIFFFSSIMMYMIDQRIFIPESPLRVVIVGYKQI